MKFTKEVIAVIKKFIVENIEEYPDDVTKETCEHFEITKPTALKYIKELISDRIIEKTGSNRYPKYQLKKEVFHWEMANVDLEEDIIWSQNIAPFFKDVSENVTEICQYGFTEMVNNVIDHSNSKKLAIYLAINAISFSFEVCDHGIGIFRKIKQDLGLEQSKHAILELAKGKFTSDPENHTGEGIFFTSRIFDHFLIFSHKLSFVGIGNDDGVILEEKYDREGTRVVMQIQKNSKKQLLDIFNEYADPDKDPSFHRTLVPVKLMEHEGDALISRSQAKRLITRFEKFSEVILDFSGVVKIGQGFADQVFRVFKNKHPEVHLAVMKATPSVSNMIKRVQAINK